MHKALSEEIWGPEARERSVPWGKRYLFWLMLIYFDLFWSIYIYCVSNDCQLITLIYISNLPKLWDLWRVSKARSCKGMEFVTRCAPNAFLMQEVTDFSPPSLRRDLAGLIGWRIPIEGHWAGPKLHKVWSRRHKVSTCRRGSSKRPSKRWTCAFSLKTACWDGSPVPGVDWASGAATLRCACEESLGAQVVWKNHVTTYLTNDLDWKE